MTLRVGILAPISWRVPPRHYGPWERVVSLLTEGLVERGVDVTLFATADSITAARLESVAPRPLSEDDSLDAKVWESLHIANAFERARDLGLDLLHNHYDFLPLSYSGLTDVPLVTTIHGFSSERILPVFKRYDGRSSYVSISNADRHPRSMSSRRARQPASTWCSSDASIRTKAWPRRSSSLAAPACGS